MAGIWHKTQRWFGRWMAPGQRRLAVRRVSKVEELENRQLLTSVLDGHWEWTPTTPITPAPEEPGPYSFDINMEGVSILSAPDFGGLPINLKATGSLARKSSGKIHGSGHSDGDSCHCSCHDADDHDDASPRVSVIPTHLVGVFHFKGPDIPKSLHTIHVDIVRGP